MPDGHSLRVYEYIESYIPILTLWIGFASILAFPHFTFLSIICQVLFLHLYIYGGHVILHLMREDNPFIIFNPHIFLHHNKSVQLDRWIELGIEGSGNFSYIILPILIQNLFHIHIFSTSIVLSGAILYVIMHIFQYSIIGDNNHALHHTHKLCNYEPEFIDTLFNTRCEPDTPYKNMSKEIPHAIVAFILAGTLKLLFTLD